MSLFAERERALGRDAVTVSLGVSIRSMPRGLPVERLSRHRTLVVNVPVGFGATLQVRPHTNGPVPASVPAAVPASDAFEASATLAATVAPPSAPTKLASTGWDLFGPVRIVLPAAGGSGCVLGLSIDGKWE